MTTNRSIFDHTSESDLLDYLRLVSKFRPSLDIESAKKIAIASIRYYKGDAKMRDFLVSGHTLELRWYESLVKCRPDYSVYDDDFFVSDVWACWIVYSRKYLLALDSNKSLSTNKSIVDVMSPNISSVVDLGCGFGYTTAGLKELFPAAKVFGTNIAETFQFKVAREVGKHRGFEIVPDISSIKGSTDLVFASEYFEHIQRPIEHLIDVINHGKPKAFILANSFGSRSVGHFNTFLHGRERIPNKSVGRAFGKTLRYAGYELIKTNLWNNRPSLWIRR